MQGSQLEVLTGCLTCLEQGEKITLVSVAKTWGTSPRPAGSLFAVSSSGRFFGSVSGGCVEEDLIEQLAQHPVRSVQRIIYGETDEERHRFALPCGGALELMAEPLNDIEDVNFLIDHIKIRKTCLRKVNLETGQISYLPWQQQTPGLSPTHWQNVFGPTWRLVVIGAGETGQYLAKFAQGLGLEVLVSDPRPDYRSNWPLKGLPLLAGFPDDIIDDLNVDVRTAIVAVAHDPKVDDMALLTALKSNAFYVGALGSKLNNQQRRARLREHFDFSEAEVNRLHGPVGLNIGSKSPAEIALSILAEITAIKNGILPGKALEKKEDQISQAAASDIS
ncbi:XdhC family protein [Endozoicomonas sp. SESOKO1]|uniref:XdhC family protein n=1 Tax=Endozoicomonas sp. SESOKO1 TaxID=2828742 RepID=UPI002148EF42|nr:XdhC family protein [Endozoicomonas sp. SESOKO1]